MAEWIKQMTAERMVDPPNAASGLGHRDGHRGAMAIWICLMSAMMAVLPVSALSAPPNRVQIEYDVSRNGTVMAQVVESFQHDGKRFAIESEVKGKGVFALVRSGSARRTSRGEILATGLRPEEFRDRRGDRAENMARFNWPGGTVLQGEEGRLDTQGIPPSTPGVSILDRLSFFWNFAFSPPRGPEIGALLTDGRSFSLFRYEIAGKDVLKVQGVDVETLRLVKRRDPGDDRQTEIWLAARRNFLPVRILIVEKDGTRLDQVAIRIGG